MKAQLASWPSAAEQAECAQADQHERRGLGNLGNCEGIDRCGTASLNSVMIPHGKIDEITRVHGDGYVEGYIVNIT